MPDDKLARLEAARQKKIADTQELTVAIKQEKKKMQAAQRAADRKADTRRKVLWGVAVDKEIEENPEFTAIAYSLADKHLYRADERALFGLAPRVATQQEQASDNAQVRLPSYAEENEMA